MKKNDLAVIAAVAVFAAVFSLILSNLLFAPQSKKEMKAQKIDSISAEFIQPDKRYFNDQSINPTQLIQIGQGTNKTAF